MNSASMKALINDYVEGWKAADRARIIVMLPGKFHSLALQRIARKITSVVQGYNPYERYQVIRTL